MNKLIQQEVKTVGDLRKLLANPEIKDDATLLSFGPDNGGYDYCDSDNVAVSYNGERLLIASGEEQKFSIFDDRHEMPGYSISGHPVFLHEINPDSRENATISHVNTLVERGLKAQVLSFEDNPKLLLFGYGTLRTDLGKYSGPQYGTKSIGFGRTKGELWQAKIRGGEWAGVKEILNDAPDTVYGEVFEVYGKKVWESLDRRESVENDCYYRKLVKVQMDDGRAVDAFIYFAGLRKTIWQKKIESGDWKDSDKVKEKN
jgi:gamma-glutamylcyclotransferase (GGCT)/AIG2-like uncharacterized protein YtfP